ncbi:MAG: maleylpyruvate isomerase family mycothiol-dependent enzyme [Actinomycetota bacterium]
MTEEKLLERLAQIGDAEARLKGTVAKLDDGDLGAPSSCAGWTRGHVIAHVVLNAHSIVNLFEWAHTGVETPQYPGWDERAADIERSSTLSVSEHLSALEVAATAFGLAARALPLDRWDFPVRGIGGDPRPVADYLTARRAEVEVHHVDLVAGYGPEEWPESFVLETMDQVPSRLGSRLDAAFMVEASDLDGRWKVGDGDPVASVEGRSRALLHWLLGRGSGDDLRAQPALPSLPSWG